MKSLETIARSLAEFFKSRDEVLLVYLFGSAAKGRMRDTSDVDVAVSAVTSLSVEKYLSLKCELQSLLGRTVDLNEAHGTILSEILTEGREIKMESSSQKVLLMKRLVFEDADFMPVYRRVMKERRDRFLE